MAALLVLPALEHLTAYAETLRRGWSPDNIRGRLAADEELARIEEDPGGFIAALDDPQGRGAPIRLADGSTVPRLPGFRRWVWDDGFCGSIGLRWQPGTEALPPHCMGHIGYGVLPEKRGRGYATFALAQVLPLARDQGLAYVDLTTEEANAASQRVILNNGGWLVERFAEPIHHGGREILRYRIDL